MGDYYWFGCQAHRDVEKAANYYAYSAAKGDPQAIFTIGMMIEEGVPISQNILHSVGVTKQLRKDNTTILTTLYSKCKESKRTEAYLPCTIALLRVQLMDIWTRYHIWMKLSSIIGIAVFTTTTFYTAHHHFRLRRQTTDTV
ncbi:hypothetical protein LOTGIDRAFT_165080 [Lottia gigantea]|uniref:Uncharacterized protein n=1 Tax=Lottia gigantea TaxID=225164 RepID=V3ZEC8_LOTGI|nr:hypothetical protein LOTGIDRAFT_165080 [Lottia gigantea]ESO89488.1 hypothetical protein LOTGIDRAFT_165080 [Lottia gigantea]